MSITLDPETEARISRRAARRGMTAEEYLRNAFMPRRRKKTAMEREAASAWESFIGGGQLTARADGRPWSEIEAAADAD